MSNPTTPFSWQMPTATDLVTDLPADFEVFGQAVATSMADLLGGTTGQILAKNSNTNMDFVWIANDQGDITGITAGNGISVTDPTGPVPTVAINTAVTADLTTAQTLTNKTLTSPVLTTPSISNINAKADILVGTADNTLGILSVGTNGQVLTADSTVSPTGLKWATPAGGGGKVLQVVFAENNTDTNIESATFTDTNLTATITPTSASSRIAIFATNQGEIFKTGGGVFGGMRLLRDSTVIMTSNGDGFFELSSEYGKFSMVQNYVDSPATTSAVTYKTQGRGTTSAVRLRFGYDGSIDTIILMEIGA